MPVHLLSDGAGPPRQVPSHLSRIPITLINTTVDCTDRTVQGRVVHKGPLVPTAADSFILKAVVTEESEQIVASINVILQGTLAQDFSQSVHQGDVVAASGFTVGKSPTRLRDKLHPFNLQLSGDHACVFVSREVPPHPPHPRSLAVVRRASAASTEVSRVTKVPKYMYVRLKDLKPGTVVNVYGVVVFFKQPFRTRGTDFCSSLKITDQSNQSVFCTIFCEKLEDHPKIFQIGDIIRLHRVKTQFFNDSIMLVNTFGFSVVTFDGGEGGPVEPRTSCQKFHFDQTDGSTVEELRAWAAGQVKMPPSPLMRLSAVQPTNYFDLTCQLLAKASIDSTCTLLRVWDGSRCAHTLLKVNISPDIIEGPSSFSARKEELIANILVYDNHVEFTRQLKPGDFLRLYNLRAIPGSQKVPGLPSSQPAELHHLSFHLHGGTAYGRGLRILPENSSDVQELKRVLDLFEDDELNNSYLMDTWSTTPESSAGAEAAGGLELLDDRHPEQLSEVRRAGPGGVHHVRVQLRSYEPRKLHQLLKLYCSKCSSMQDVPDEELVENLFSQASRSPVPCDPPPWALSGMARLPPGPLKRTLSIHMSKQLVSEGKTTQLIFIMGSSLEEAIQLTSGYQNVVPVMSSGGHMTLLDLSAPFLFRGRKRFYGSESISSCSSPHLCRNCSDVVIKEPWGNGVELINEKTIAEAFGIQLMQFVFLMKFKLQDATDSLDVFLFRDAELFFGVTAEDAAANQEAQSRICRMVESICPPEDSTGERPWLHLCLVSYSREDDFGQNQTCYQICHSAIASSSPDLQAPFHPPF
ncbi:protection of telomeres protein 1 isoform X2 [Takifugu flavidus]|uniref:protection of telomeres protein 1 isoform X2 n=1 Tax=Takifugu flavidus TaxID=433684 RepID=UPI002544B70B|nr:protection of telomeres protein 1 isoform X2 [Takifugu flavidus]XP_056907867.1 protection of telomeres protein 1 isoform X2 [Takifugu flavidus]XP_056907868.1 protection of telomeres protein 1 isoform X2 [Takifugu flavidus]